MGSNIITFFTKGEYVSEFVNLLKSTKVLK